MRRADRAVWGKSAALVLSFAAMGWYFNRPIPGPAAYPLGDIDQLFQLATLEWERWSLLHQPGSFFQGLSFYGIGDSLFFSDLLLGSLPIYVLLAGVFGPVLGFNLMHALLPALNGLVMFGALRRLLANPWAAMVGAVVFAFSPPQIGFGQHFQLQMLMWTALMLWFLVIYVQEKRPWALGAATLCLSIQFATAVYPGYFAALTLAFMLAGAAVSGSLPLRDWRSGAQALAAAGVGLLPILLVIAGYRGFENDWQIARDIREVARYSAGMPAYLSESLRDQWWVGAAGNLTDSKWLSGSGPPVMIPLALAAAGVYCGIREQTRRWVVIGGLALMVVGFVLSLGPELRWWGRPTGIALPYQFLFETFPEFRALRVATRFAMAAMLGVSLLAAIGAEGIWRWVSAGGAKRYALPAGLSVLLALEFLRGPIPSGQLPGRDALTAALAETGGPAIFVPADISIWEEPIRLWVAVEARVQMVNGYSGFQPPAYRQFAALVDEAGTEEVEQVIAALHAYGLRTVVVDMSRMPASAVAGWLDASRRSAGPPDYRVAEQFIVIRIGEPAAQVRETGWGRVEVDFYRSGVRAGEELAAFAFVSNPGPEPWLPPDGTWARATTMIWTGEDGSQESQPGELFRVPPVVAAGSGAKIDGPVRAVAPARPGEYTLSLVVDGTVLASRQITVYPPDGQAAGAGDAGEVVVLYVSRAALTDRPARLEMAAFNTGDTAWDGSYRVGYRWIRLRDDGSAEETGVEGRLFFAGSIEPGMAEIVGGVIEMPADPGSYLLRYGVVNETVEWLTVSTAAVTLSR